MRVLLYAVAVWSANFMVELTKEKDPEEVVIDEVVGYFFSFLRMTLSQLSLVKLCRREVITRAIRK